MSTYTVKHLHNQDVFSRPAILLNDKSSYKTWVQTIDAAVEGFHKQLPHYGETKLHSLPSVASELGLGQVFLKDESTRFGLPSFKILGASWAVHRALCKRLHLPSSTLLADLKQAVQSSEADVRLVTCTDGNWGRAAARMAKYVGLPATVYVPGFMVEYTQNLIRGEGADVRVVQGGSYDDAIAAVQQDAGASGALMVLDTSWHGYEEVPGWVTEGYETMLRETDRQVAAVTNGRNPDLVIGSVGVGSWMHAVTEHYRVHDSEAKVVTVEPDTAACFKESLHCGELTSIETGDTIMCGMNCGTPSTIAWPVLRDGVFAAVAVTDIESHECTQELQSLGVNAGPCGAATLAALRRLCGKISLERKSEMIVVLFSTEGMREYEVPRWAGR